MTGDPLEADRGHVPQDSEEQAREEALDQQRRATMVAMMRSASCVSLTQLAADGRVAHWITVADADPGWFTVVALCAAWRDATAALGVDVHDPVFAAKVQEALAEGAGL